MRTIAVVVARGGSRRLPRKALLEISPGVSMIAWAVERLGLCDKVDRIVVGSDSDEILEAARQCRVVDPETIKRDAFHCDEAVCTANDMIGDMVGRIDAADTDVLLWAHPTNPLIESCTYDRAVEAFLDAERNGFDSLLSVREVRRHAWDGAGPVNYDPWAKRHRPASELPPRWYQDGAIFIQRFGAARANRYFFGGRPLLFKVDEFEGLDVDTERDLIVARRLVSHLPLEVRP